MSIHAQLHHETEKKLRNSQRNSTLTAILIALFSCVLLALVLSFFFLKSLLATNEELISYKVGTAISEVIEKPEIVNQVERQPPSPASSMAKMIIANTASPISIPVPTINTPDPSLELGNGNDFGSGWGDGSGNGAGGSAGGFGSPVKIGGTLAGYLYDFKQTSSGQPIANYDTGNRSHFTEPVDKIQTSRFSDSSFRKFYKAPQELFVRYIAIPFSNANEGPKYFNAEKEVKPSGWLVHYQGQLTVPADGTYRLVGSGDDYLSVAINRKMRLVAGWSDIQSAVEVRGANADADETPNQKGPFGIPLRYGSWIKLKKGQTIDVDIAIGERPGGKVGFVLMLEEKETTYQTEASGRKILPPFTFGQLHPDDLDYLEKFPGWKWETNNIPIFPAK